MNNKKIKIEELKEFMANMGPDTKIFFGADSERYKRGGKWYADYICVVVVHIDGCKGGKIFAEVTTELDHDQRKDRPFNRLMTEAMKIAELYLRTKEIFYDFEVEIHLDINSDEEQGSYCAVAAATGYIKGICGVNPVLKPDAFAASFGADRAKEILNL